MSTSKFANIVETALILNPVMWRRYEVLDDGTPIVVGPRVFIFLPEGFYDQFLTGWWCEGLDEDTIRCYRRKVSKRGRNNVLGVLVTEEGVGWSIEVLTRPITTPRMQRIIRRILSE